MTRFDAAADRQVRTTDLLSMNSDYTVMGWAYLSSDTNTYQTFYGVSDDSTNNFDTCGASADGTTFMVGRTNGGAGTFVENTGAALSLSTWYHWCVVRSGSNLTGYLNGVQNVTISSSISGRAAATRMELGGATSGNLSRLDGRENYIKAWAAALTLAEINIERLLIRPTRLANLYGWWPLMAGSAERLRDYSGFGRAWTEAGTLTDEDQPPVAWGGRFYLLPYTPPAQTITLSGITSDETFGTQTVNRGAVSVAPPSIASGEAVGTLSLALNVSPPSIASGEAFGVSTVTPGGVVVSPSSIASAEAFGTPVISVGGVTVALSGIASAESIGNMIVSAGGLFIAPPSIASAEAFGTLTLVRGSVTIMLNGIPSAEEIGTLTILRGGVVVSPTGIPTGETFGTTIVTTSGLVITLTGISSAESVGNIAVLRGTVVISGVGGISSATAMGTLTIQHVGVNAFRATVSIENAGSVNFSIENAGAAVLELV